MKVLVTGSNGFLGSALVDRLLAHGETDVRCLVRPASNRARLEEIERRRGIALDVTVGSLGTKEAAERAVEGVDAVYHVAAAMGGAPADMFLNTVVASKNLLEALAHTGRSPRVILISSFGVYGVADLPRGYLVDENTPLETRPAQRDLYSQAKLRQERLFWEYQARYGFPLTVLRPGVIYGPGGNAFSGRVGMNLFGVFLHLGGDNLLPLTYVDNCAEAIALAGRSDVAKGQVYNVHDDDLPTCDAYLARYKREVKPIRSIPVPYVALAGISRLVERYHAYSKGQLPAIFTPYKTATTWKGNRFDNTKLKALGWKQLVSTEEGLQRTFAYLRALSA
ncbi:epimerase [Sorangium cellulosum]|uniref:Epimerase n=1 Tax=Sorangium cellulosum TaxID=56 RepID=A0A4P2PUK0_SORCE|nr:NAD(P)-dependent oxidoreductase [Sorangium cellulosum]AUX20425.1 epimerase [Sorangium cellulosum]